MDVVFKTYSIFYLWPNLPGSNQRQVRHSLGVPFFGRASSARRNQNSLPLSAKGCRKGKNAKGRESTRLGPASSRESVFRVFGFLLTILGPTSGLTLKQPSPKPMYSRKTKMLPNCRLGKNLDAKSKRKENARCAYLVWAQNNVPSTYRSKTIHNLF